MTGGAPGTATGAPADTPADGPPCKNKKVSKGLPRGVTETTSGKFQGRANYKAPGAKRGMQRNVGTFATAEAAGQAVADAEARLKAEGDAAVWTEPARKNEHKRGEVSCAARHITRSYIVPTTVLCPSPPLSTCTGSTSRARD